MAEKLYNVLFLCTGNSARTSWPRRCSTGGAAAVSAPLGRQPPDGPRPSLYARPAAQARISAPNGLRSKSWREFAAAGRAELDFVFTVCDSAAGEACPIWPGQPMTAHWGVPDPAAVTGTEAEKPPIFAEAFRMLSRRISIFVSLPIATLDRIRLQKRLDEMGGATKADA